MGTAKSSRLKQEGRSNAAWRSHSPGLLSRRVTSLEVDNSRTSTGALSANRNPSHPLQIVRARTGFRRLPSRTKQILYQRASDNRRLRVLAVCARKSNYAWSSRLVLVSLLRFGCTAGRQQLTQPRPFQGKCFTQLRTGLPAWRLLDKLHSLARSEPRRLGPDLSNHGSPVGALDGQTQLNRRQCV